MKAGKEFTLTLDGEEIATVNDFEIANDGDHSEVYHEKETVSFEVNFKELLKHESRIINYSLEIFGEDNDKNRFKKYYRCFTFSEWLSIMNNMLAFNKVFKNGRQQPV